MAVLIKAARVSVGRCERIVCVCTMRGSMERHVCGGVVVRGIQREWRVESGGGESDIMKDDANN